jgi:3-oxoacyl-[acyl-carrier protein] reductase
MSTSPQVAIVTGSSSGIGAAIALRLAVLKWNVVINYSRSASDAEAVAAQCRAAGAQAIAVQADVSDDAACRALAQAALKAYGRIDGLVNNAGTTKFAPASDLEALSADDFMRLYQTNVVSMYQMARAVAPAMKAQGAGSIVNITSRAGISGAGSSIAYAASKGAGNTLTLSLARALAPAIRVNAVAPGFVETRWHAAQGDEVHAKQSAAYAAKAVLKRTVQADEVADAAVWLLTGGGAATGQIVSVDSGAHLG